MFREVVYLILKFRVKKHIFAEVKGGNVFFPLDVTKIVVLPVFSLDGPMS